MAGSRSDGIRPRRSGARRVVDRPRVQPPHAHPAALPAGSPATAPYREAECPGGAPPDAVRGRDPPPVLRDWTAQWRRALLRAGCTFAAAGALRLPARAVADDALPQRDCWSGLQPRDTRTPADTRGSARSAEIRTLIRRGRLQDGDRLGRDAEPVRSRRRHGLADVHAPGGYRGFGPRRAAAPVAAAVRDRFRRAGPDETGRRVVARRERAPAAAAPAGAERAVSGRVGRGRVAEVPRSRAQGGLQLYFVLLLRAALDADWLAGLRRRTADGHARMAEPSADGDLEAVGRESGGGAEPCAGAGARPADAAGGRGATAPAQD